MLWPDSDRTQALANLRTALSELRGALGSEGKRLETPDRHTVRIDLGDASVDLLEFDHRIKIGKLLDLERAVSLYCGGLLEGSSEEWVAQERQAREHDCLQALQTLGEAALQASDYRAAINWFQRAILLDPWWDAAQRGLMQALANDGNLNESLRVYRVFEERLRSETAGSPDEQTSALYHQLRVQARGERQQTSGKPERSSSSLPAPISELIGRDDEMVDLAVLLRRSRLVTLTGVGGIGKTRLALVVGNLAEAEFTDGCCFVPLDAISDGERVPQQICTTFGLQERPGETWLQIAIAHLRPKRALLILDNCEHLLGACAQVCTCILQECSGVRILSTSRERLGVIGESVCAVPGLPVPEPAHLPAGLASKQKVVASYEGVQLFVERGRASNRTFDINASNVQALAEVCHALEGVPLAIELAAAHVRMLTVPQILSRLGDYLGLLTGSNRGVNTRHHTLRSTLNWSYELLGEDERILLQRLSVFVGGWTLEAAEEVCGGDGLDSLNVRGLLGSLVDKSLVVFLEDSPKVSERYRMLETVRQYADERLAESTERESVESRHRRWCLGFAERAGAGLVGKEQASWLKLVAVEYDNLLKVLAGFESDPDGGLEGLRLSSSLQWFWINRGLREEGRDLMQRALRHKGAGAESSERALGLYCAGALAYYASDLVAARPLFEECLALRRSFGDRAGMVSPINALASLLAWGNDSKAAMAAYEECLQLAKELNDRSSEAVVLSNLGCILATDLLEAKRGREHYQESLQIYRELGTPRNIAVSLEGVGLSAIAMGDYDAAQASFEEALAIVEELHDYRLPWVTLRLGYVAFAKGDLDTSLEYCNQGWKALFDANDNLGLAIAPLHLGELALARSNLSGAEVHFQEALSLNRSRNDRSSVVYSLIGLANIRLDRGELGEARLFLSEGLKLACELTGPRCIACCLVPFADLTIQEGDSFGGVRLWAALHSALVQGGEKRPRPIEERVQKSQQKAREIMGDDAFEAAWKNGLSLSLEQVAAEAMATFSVCCSGSS